MFNDDKKTELIGECWVPLDKIVVRGGGQNDLWHHLNCRGKFAGEIRIEITYYDTRPKDTRIEETQQSIASEMVPDTARDEVRGPRQPKPVKRRPLPASPMESPVTSHYLHASPSSQALHGLPDFSNHETAVEAEHFSQYQDQPPYEAASEVTMSDAEPFDHHRSSSSYPHTPPHSNSQSSIRSSQLSQGDARRTYASSQGIYEEPENGVSLYQPNNLWTETRPVHAEAVPFQDHHYHSHRPSDERQLPYLPEQFHPGSMHSDEPNGTTSRTDENPSVHDQPSSQDHFNSPPPPPIHRNSGSRPGVVHMHSEPNRSAMESPHTPSYNQHNRSPMTGSPLAQVYSIDSGPDSASSNPLQSSFGNIHPAPHRTAQDPAQHGMPRPSFRDRGQSVPSALVPGYERGHSGHSGSPNWYDRQNGIAPLTNSPRRPPLQQGPLGRSDPRIPQNHAPLEGLREHKAHRNSAPLLSHAQSAQNIQAPQRKSVSPQPHSMPTERRHSAMPFSPDSFDAFNPNTESNYGLNQVGARYTTPDQAREQAIQSEREQKRGDEPIISSDGRVIDPSDHLPADTWAPEPEQKTPKRTPEVTLRFKHSPHSTQSLPRAGRTPLAETRPNAMSSPPQPPSGENSPVSAGRARLQKKARMCMPQPNSSPVVPTLETTTPSPRQPLPRHYASEYPLRERENYAYPNSSPTYGKRSSGGIPPPVPGKIPIERGNEYWGDGSALSEELRSIDIGVGSGHRARVKRYGF